MLLRSASIAGLLPDIRRIREALFGGTFGGSLRLALPFSMSSTPVSPGGIPLPTRYGAGRPDGAISGTAAG